MNSAPRDTLLCLVFFTRLPLPQADFGDRSLAQAIWAAPLAGLAVALIGATVFAIAGWFGLASSIAAALALASTLFATGCLHEDGLSDTADGFGGGRTREKKLEIMRDSRIGAFGSCALILSLLLRWTVLDEIEDAWPVLLALVAAHAGSRGLFAAFMHWTPAARADGLSAGAGIVARETAFAGLVLGALALLPIGLGGFFATLIVLALIFFGLRRLAMSQIGGQTGDVIGALQQVAEIAILLVASTVLV